MRLSSLALNGFSGLAALYCILIQSNASSSRLLNHLILLIYKAHFYVK